MGKYIFRVSLNLRKPNFFVYIYRSYNSCYALALRKTLAGNDLYEIYLCAWVGTPLPQLTNSTCFTGVMRTNKGGGRMSHVTRKTCQSHGSCSALALRKTLTLVASFRSWFKRHKHPPVAGPETIYPHRRS